MVDDVYFYNLPSNKWWLDINSIYLTKESWDKLTNFIVDKTKLYISIKELYDIVGKRIVFYPSYIPNNIDSFKIQYKRYYMQTKKTYELFHLYAKKWGFESWEDLVKEVMASKFPTDGITNHTLNLYQFIKEHENNS